MGKENIHSRLIFIDSKQSKKGVMGTPYTHFRKIYRFYNEADGEIIVKIKQADCIEEPDWY